MTREEIYEKAYAEKDIIRQIIKLHTLDTITGNKREELNYVDGLYPAIETLFDIDNCLEAIANKHVLRSYYEEHYRSDIDYDTLCSYFAKAKEVCDNTKDKNKILNVCNDVIELLSNVYLERKTKTK